MIMMKKRILVVDDEPGFTEMVKLNLEATGRYEVVVENEGERALTRALACIPDLILLDVIMPEMEGPDVVRQIRENSVLKDVPIVFVTASVTKEEVDANHGNIGGHAFLAKPGTVNDLVDCIQRELLVRR